MPQISVIVPVYNAEPYLRCCVDSVLAQSFTDYELILVDDGSSDNCGAICDEYAEKDARVRVIHKENGGVSSARNAGLDAAKGEYIAFLDADDEFALGFLSDAYADIRQNDSEIYMAGHARMSREGILRHTFQISFGPARVEMLVDPDIFIELLKSNYSASSCGKLFSRARIGELRFDTELCFGEDLRFMWTLLQRAQRIFATPEIGYFYMENPRSATSAVPTREKCDSMARIYLFIFDFDLQYWGKEQPSYQAFCRKRWRKDYLCTVISISDSRLSRLEKLAMFRLLYCNRDLRRALYEGEKHRCLFFYNPYYQSLKRKWKRYAEKRKRGLK